MPLNTKRWRAMLRSVIIATSFAAAAVTPAMATTLPPATVAADMNPTADDLSPWGMFEEADLIVKGVITGLGIASMVTWAVWLAKAWELHVARRDVRRDLEILRSSAVVEEASGRLRDGATPVARLVEAAAREMQISAKFRAEGLKERIAMQFERIEMSLGRKASRGTGVLATIGSTAPFVGLFGTVWGIMNSFIGIADAHTTNLAVVAPGIAQALFATACGLVTAIPAVVIYNMLARQTAHYRAQLGDASAQLMRVVSRELDCAKAAVGQAVQAAAVG